MLTNRPTLSGVVKQLRNPEWMSHIQFVVALAIYFLPNKSYAREIRRVIFQLLDHDVDQGQIYVAIKRMEEKGLVSGVQSMAPDGSNRKVRILALTDVGVQWLETLIEHYTKAHPKR